MAEEGVNCVPNRGDFWRPRGEGKPGMFGEPNYVHYG